MKLSEIAKEIRESSLRIYLTPKERAALRCGLSDATALCDNLAKEIRSEWIGRGGITKKKGQELAAVAERCAEAIWHLLYKKVEVKPRRAALSSNRRE